MQLRFNLMGLKVLLATGLAHMKVQLLQKEILLWISILRTQKATLQESEEEYMQNQRDALI